MDALIGITGLMGFFVFLVWLFVALIKKKPKKKLLLLGMLVCFAMFVIGVSMPSSASDDSDNQQPKKEVVETSPTPEAVVPDIELANDYEKAVWQIALDNDGKLISVSDEDDAIYFDIKCKNDEKVVNKILDEIAAAAKENAIEKLTTITIKDIKKDSTQNLVLADVTADGSIDIAFTSGDYKSKYNTWLSDQFSSYNGSHYVLESLIEDNLHNAKSYEHIETTYRIVSKEDVKTEINNTLSDAGYDYRVEINDLFVMTTFSAENAFGATVKNYAYGIVSYSKDTVTLVDIELA